MIPQDAVWLFTLTGTAAVAVLDLLLLVRPARKDGTDPRFVDVLRNLAHGFVLTAVWSLAAAVYLTLGPGVGVVGTDGPGWIVMAATTAMCFFLLWAWADPTAKVG